MKKYLTSNRVVSSIYLQKSSHQGAFLVVEGEPDSDVFGNFVDNTCKVVPAYGNTNVKSAIELLSSQGFLRAIGIIDADYSLLLGHEIANGLFLTDTHDLESMLLISPALDKLVARLLKGEDKNHRKRFADTIRSQILKLSKKVGYLRWYSLLNKLSLGFKNLDIGNYIDPSDFELDLRGLIQDANSSQSPLMVEELITALDEFEDANHDLWQIAHGKDMLQILVVLLPAFLEKSVGTNHKLSPDLCTYKKFENDLCHAYEFDYFRETCLYQAIRSWEKAHSTYRVFRQ